MLKFNSNILKWNGKWGNAVATPAPTIYQVHTYTDGNGTLLAVPSSGISGTLVDLTATPNTGYDFKEYQVVGATIADNQLTINDSDVSVTALFEQNDPWNPLNLPAYTLRVQLTDTSYDCSNKGFVGTWVSRGNGVWDITYANTSWRRLLTDSIGYWGNKKVHSILGMNSTGVTNMERFEDCAQTYLIGTIPLFDTTALTDVTNAFYETYYVEGGQLALYQQMSSQANPPSSHSGCFSSCGSSSTAESKAETAHIPTSWGGTAT